MTLAQRTHFSVDVPRIRWGDNRPRQSMYGTLPKTNSSHLKMMVSKFGISELPGVHFQVPCQFSGMYIYLHENHKNQPSMQVFNIPVPWMVWKREALMSCSKLKASPVFKSCWIGDTLST